MLVNERRFVPTDAFSFLDEANCPPDSAMMRALRMQLLGLDPGVIQGVLISESLDHATKAIRAIAHGDVDGPGGLEGLAMAIAGEGMGDSLTRAIRERSNE